MNKTRVQNWRYDDGWYDIPVVLREKYGGQEKEFREELIGWHCWVYAGDDAEFNDWMEKNMKGSFDCTFRFNSGDPMHTVTIKDNEDATLFKLTWM